MHERLLERWVSNIKGWRKQKLPIKEVIERMSVLAEDEREQVRHMLYQQNTRVPTGTDEGKVENKSDTEVKTNEPAT